MKTLKEMKPEVRRFVEAQKRKDTITVEQMYLENLRKEKINLAQKNRQTRGGRKNISFY